MRKSIHSAQQKRLIALLKELRGESGLTQAQLARKLRRSQGTVSRYERGELQLDVLELQQICQALGTTLSAFTQRFEKPG